MPLSEDENDLFNDLFFEKRHPIDQTYQAQLRNIDAIDNLNKHQLYYPVIIKYARDVIEARINSFIEIYKQGGKYPNEEDFEAICC